MPAARTLAEGTVHDIPDGDGIVTVLVARLSRNHRGYTNDVAICDVVASDDKCWLGERWEIVIGSRLHGQCSPSNWSFSQT